MKLEDAKELAELAVRHASAAGASYAEARVHGSRERAFALKNGEPQPAMFGESYGIGLRALCRGALAFSATNSLDRARVNDLTERTVKLARASASLLEKPIVFDHSKAVRKKWAAEEKESLDGADAQWLRGILNDIESRIRDGKAGVGIQGRILTLAAEVEEKFYVNSDGARVQSRVPRVGFFGVLTASEGDRMAQRVIQEGQSGGKEVVERIGLIGGVEQEAKMLGKVLGTTAKPPNDEVDVILSPELAGIAAHESVGHPQEADRILGREGAQAGESYLKASSLGAQVGSSEASVSDDPTLLHSNGYYIVDDEGVEGRKRKLITNGKVTEFLQNRYTAAEFGVPSNGASRSSAFDREPIVRMSNTFVEPGDRSFDELLREVKHGVYFKTFMEWNIDDKRFNQRYVALEAYAVEQGEMTGLVNAPVLEITTPRLWGSVKARSKTFEFKSGVCGKGDPQQGVPVWHGGPEMLLTGIKLGSR